MDETVSYGKAAKGAIGGSFLKLGARDKRTSVRLGSATIIVCYIH